MSERELQTRMQTLIRRFGLLSEERTPCGRPLPPSQAHALQAVGEAGPLSQQRLSEELGLDKSTTSRLVAQLTDQGWVAKGVNPENRREFLLTLTAAGQRVLGEIAAASADRFREILARIPAEKQAQVLQSLDLLTIALRKD